MRRKATLLAATSSDDANPANAKGKECVKSVFSSSKVMEATLHSYSGSRSTKCSRGRPPYCSGNSSRSEEVRLPIWRSELGKTSCHLATRDRSQGRACTGGSVQSRPVAGHMLRRGNCNKRTKTSSPHPRTRRSGRPEASGGGTGRVSVEAVERWLFRQSV